MSERVVNIIGMGQTAYDVPDTGEMWCIADAYMRVKPDRMLLMHAWNLTESSAKNRGGLALLSEYMKHPEIKVFTPSKMKIFDINENPFKDTIQYPLLEVTKICGGLCFCCTFAYAIGLAIFEKVDRIRLYGIEFWSQGILDEYDYQAENKFQWLDMAKGAGLKIDMPYIAFRQSRNKYNLYGYTELKLS